MNESRDYLEEAMAIVDGQTDLLPGREHLSALHEHHKFILHKRVVGLLRLLDAEHSHQTPCETCKWLSEQPEYAEIIEEGNRELWP